MQQCDDLRRDASPWEAFGFLLSTGSLGQTAFTAFATSLAPLQMGPVAGWQFALTLNGCLTGDCGQGGMLGVYLEKVVESHGRWANL